MQKNKKHKLNLKIIKKIEKIRSKNNINWMNLLRVALKHDPKKTSKIMSQVYFEDKEISKLVKKLSKINKR
tara:strand:+ start:169 stop:381 length:213 start_codon:yes stop_codon:yes gene_type:complete